MNDLENTLAEIYKSAWARYSQNVIQVDIKRQAFNASLVRSEFGQNIKVCDIGGPL